MWAGVVLWLNFKGSTENSLRSCAFIYACLSPSRSQRWNTVLCWWDSLPPWPYLYGDLPPPSRPPPPARLQGSMCRDAPAAVGRDHGAQGAVAPDAWRPGLTASARTSPSLPEA